LTLIPQANSASLTFFVIEIVNISVQTPHGRVVEAHVEVAREKKKAKSFVVYV
jgi:hypothetical protein